MKKFIIMGLTLFAFTLVGCKDDKKGDDDTAKQKKECEDAGKVWKEDNTCVDKEADDGTPEATYTIGNPLEEALAVSSGDASVSVAKDNCLTVTASQWAALKIDGVCDNSNVAAADATEEDKKAVTDDDCPEAGNYNVKVAEDDENNTLVKADKAGENCAELKKEEAAPAS